MTGGAVPTESETSGEIGSTNTGGNTFNGNLQYYYYYDVTPTTAGIVRYGHFYTTDGEGSTARLAIYSSDGQTQHICCVTGTLTDGVAGYGNCDAGTTFELQEGVTYRMVINTDAYFDSQSSGTTKYYNHNWAANYGTCSNSIVPTQDGIDYALGYPTIIWNNTAGNP